MMTTTKTSPAVFQLDRTMNSQIMRAAKREKGFLEKWALNFLLSIADLGVIVLRDAVKSSLGGSGRKHGEVIGLCGEPSPF